MLIFEPPELQQHLKAALDTLEDVISYSWFPVNDDDFDPADHDDETVTPETEIDGCGLASDESSSNKVTVNDLLVWADGLHRFKLRDRTVLRLERESLFHIAPLGGDEFALASAISERKLQVDTTVTIEGATFAVGLQTGLTLFAVFIEAQGENDEHLPSFWDTTVYVRVRHPKEASDALVLQVVQSFLFEMAATAGLVFSVEPYPAAEYWDDEDATPRHSVELRPLVLGPGLSDLHALFLAGSSAKPVEYALIHFVKVIEYVSATVIRLARHDVLRRRLSGKGALSPNAAFLDDLATLIEEQRSFNKDAEALKLTLQTCCDPVVLAADAPSCLPQLRSTRESVDAKQKRAAMDELSACLSATRNQLSHAKANYVSTGAECPSDQLEQLTNCTQGAAEQVIRWFARLPSSSRLV